MDPTKDEAEPGAEPGAAREAEAAEARPTTAERGRARAYLDLWERHVVLAALTGPAPPHRPPS